jgi:DNA primase catalytic core
MYEDEPTLEEMKRAVHILPLAAILGLNPRKISQGEYVVKCPNPSHEDKTPSCHINHHKNVFHCKGCGQGGTVVDWLMLTENLNEAGAIKRLKEEFGKVDVAKRQIEVEEKQPAPVNIYDPVNQKALSYYIDFCHKMFMSKTEGASYLMKRGLIYGEIVEEFKIGFSDGSLNPSQMNIKESEIYQALFDLGILKNEDGSTGSPTSNGSTREHFSNRVIFPVFDENGLIVQIYGRNIGAIGAKHMLLSTPLTLFNPRALISPEIILCESVIDALSIMAMGYRNVAAVLSVNGMKDDLFEKIINSNIKKVFIAFDNDQPGNNAASSLAEKLIDHKIESYRITFDEGSDANDLLRKSENIETAKKKISELLENAPALKQIMDTPAPYESGRVESLSKNGKEYIYQIGQRQYTIRGLDQNKTDSALKIFLRLDYEEPTKHEKRFHIDNNLDLFNAKTTGIFSRAAASKLTLDERVISADLDSLTVKLDELLKRTIEEKENKTKDKERKKEFHKNLKTSFEASLFLDDPLFVLRLINDFEKAGVVGERLNMFVAFVATLSRWMKYPLHIIIQSESSAGKSNMLNLLNKLVPEEESLYFTQVTPKSFYYGEKDYLKCKVIFIAEGDGLKEAEYAIKQFMSEGRLSISYTKADPKTGENTSESSDVEGPAQIIITEPREGINEEIINRSLVLILDMSPEQTRRIQDYQRLLDSPEGVVLRKERETICDFYRHVQRELKPWPILNEFSKILSFHTRSHQARRENQMYLTLLNCLTILNQRHRERIIKNGETYIKTHPIDIAWCNFMAKHVFSHSAEELSPQTLVFMKTLVRYFIEEAEKQGVEFDQLWFRRKEARQITGLGNSRAAVNLDKMVDYEILTCRRDQNGLMYRFLYKPDIDYEIDNLDRLKLVRMADILKHASKKERQEFEAFKPSLEKIFKALDPKYKGEGI